MHTFFKLINYYYSYYIGLLRKINKLLHLLDRRKNKLTKSATSKYDYISKKQLT